jgi:hypothetical protein
MTIRLLDPAGPNRDSVLDMLRTLCPAANFSLNPDGTVRINTMICRDLPETAGIEVICRCLCHMVGFGTEVRIRVAFDLSAFGGGVTFDDNPDDSVMRGDPPVLGRGTGSEVRIENRGRWRARRMDDPTQIVPEPDWLILAHELCGHALRMQRGDHTERRPGRPRYDPNWHNQALAVGQRERAARGMPQILEPPFL